MMFVDVFILFNILVIDVNGGGLVIFNKEYIFDMCVLYVVCCLMLILLLFSFKVYEKYMLVDGVILVEDVLF